MSGNPAHQLVERYPDWQLPLEQTLKLFPDHTLENLAEKGITAERLQRIAFHALYVAQYNHFRGTPVAVDTVDVLTQRFAHNALKNALEYRRTKASSGE